MEMRNLKRFGSSFSGFVRSYVNVKDDLSQKFRRDPLWMAGRRRRDSGRFEAKCDAIGLGVLEETSGRKISSVHAANTLLPLSGNVATNVQCPITEDSARK